MSTQGTNQQAGEGEFLKLQGDETDQPPATGQSQVHQEGIDHVKAQTFGDGADGSTGGGSSNPPASNPGSEDASGGIGSTSGGAYPSDTKTEVTSSSAVPDASTDSSVVQRDEPKADNPAKDDSMTSSDQAPGSNVVPKASTDDSVVKRDEPATDSGSKDDSTTEKRDDDDAPGEGSSHAKKDNWPKENRDAIPTAGGEQLGEKHWGESQVVPDNPKPEGESNVSSKEGQPDKQTSDNTAQNTGGAAPPTGSSSNEGNSGANTNDGEGKQKFTDKIKDKLNIGKKE